VRVHRLRTGRVLRAAEAGFAIYGQREDGRALEPLHAPGADASDSEAFGTLEVAGAARAASRAGVSGVLAMEAHPSRVGAVIRLDANSNLVEARAALPTILSEHQPSNKNIWLITGVFALPRDSEEPEGAHAGWAAEWKKRPEISLDFLLPK